MLLVGGSRVTLNGRHRQALQVPHLRLDPRRVGGRLLHHGDVVVVAVTVVGLDLERYASQTHRQQRCNDGQEMQYLHLAEFSLLYETTW